MSYAVVLSRANQGLDAPLVRVEVHLSNGLPAFTVVGMPETAVRESKDRVRSALLSSHFEFPDRRITVNLAPADLPKGGGRFDLPIALGILCASGQLPLDVLKGCECLGELALDGTLRPVRGAVAAAIAATAAGRRIVLPQESAQLCATVVPGSRPCAANDLLALCAALRGKLAPLLLLQEHPKPVSGNLGNDFRNDLRNDLRNVAGQLVARRALEIAAAGTHNLLFLGPPGTGKSLLASCLPGILPRPAEAERQTMAALYDLQGQGCDAKLRPFRNPHHSASAAALIGGGSIPRPGEASLAHGGVLFLDELPEFSRHTLDMLREPMETGEVCIARARCSVRYPARFQLVAAMNPCPCGFAGDDRRGCRCSAAQRNAYAARVSGPMLDRIDLQVRVSREDPATLFDNQTSESSTAVATRVQSCSQRQQQRQGCSNAALQGDGLLQACGLGRLEQQLLRDAAARMQLSARAMHRTLRTARTIADLAEKDSVDADDLTEALGYRAVIDGPK